MSPAAASTGLRVRFFNGGHCRQLQALVDRRTWRFARFHAVFLAIERRPGRWTLVDSGYSTHLPAATRAWPAALYRAVLPVRSEETTAAILARHGIDPAAVEQIILTHFHADHIGGLRDFPGARFFHVQEALEHPLRESRWRQLSHAFFAGLLPADFGQRASAIPLRSFREDKGLGFPVYDLFGDGSVRLVSLPGHAPGHVGVWIEQAQGGPLLYVADGYWHHREIDPGVTPMFPAQWILSEPARYAATVGRLREVARRGDVRVVSCHCPRTQGLVECGPETLARSATLS